MADTPRKRWVRVTLSVVDVPDGKVPSGGYDEAKLAEQSFSVPVESELETIVSSDEVSSSVRAIVQRVNKHAPRSAPEPEPQAEPIGGSWETATPARSSTPSVTSSRPEPATRPSSVDPDEPPF